LLDLNAVAATEADDPCQLLSRLPLVNFADLQIIRQLVRRTRLSTN
jgi:hypothetical protein